MTPLHFSKFNDRIRALNASHGKELKMTAAEARALHTDIFDMLEELYALRVKEDENTVIEVVLDPGDNSL
jgi:hypothetical protein